MIVQHVALEVRPDDADAEARFWGLLGFDAVRVPDGIGDRALWLQAGTAQVHLFLVDDPVVPPRGHTAVVRTDYEAAQATLRGAGFAIDERARHWGAPRCFVTSPAGHRVEVMAAPPG